MPPEAIIVADDHPLFRDGLCALIQTVVPGAEILPVDSYEGAISVARGLPTKSIMLVLDLFFSERNIKLQLPALRREFDHAVIVVVSMAEDQATVDAVIACGVNGYISKAVPPKDMISGLCAVLDGEQVINVPGAARSVPSDAPALSERQLEVLQHIAAGSSNKEIALALDISPFTVRIHVTALFRSLGVHTRSAAVAKAVAKGVLNL